MKLLREIGHSELSLKAIPYAMADLQLRRAARAVVADKDGRIALLYVRKNNYHKLPGGGIEAAESIRQALERELLEEVGCQAEVIAEIGKIVEYRAESRMKQISYCFLTQQLGPIEQSNFTEKELYEGFELLWVKNISEAINLLQKDTPRDYAGKFIRQRDLTFLKAVHAGPAGLASPNYPLSLSNS